LHDKVIVSNGIAHEFPGSRAIEPTGGNDRADASLSVDHGEKLQPAWRIDPTFDLVAECKVPFTGSFDIVAAKANLDHAYPFPECQDRTVGRFVAGSPTGGHGG
jgi:hypothetical protein